MDHIIGDIEGVITFRIDSRTIKRGNLVVKTVV